MSSKNSLPLTPFADVIGKPIDKSKSPVIHNFWLEKLQVNASYQSASVTEHDLEQFINERRKDPHWRGCNVTMPHKQSIVAHLNGLDAVATKLGAVNTVVSDPSGKLTGYNTDAAGFIEPLAPILRSQHLFRMARIIGTGGAARAIIAALADNGFTLVVAGRNPSKARELLVELAPQGEHHAIALSHFKQPIDFPFDDREGCLDLIVNASPLGMEGQPPLEFDWSHAPPGSIAYDIVTTPRETEFLEQAKANGHPTINGLSMLIGQAAIAFEKFFGAPAPREHDRELREILTS